MFSSAAFMAIHARAFLAFAAIVASLSGCATRQQISIRPDGARELTCLVAADCRKQAFQICAAAYGKPGSYLTIEDKQVQKAIYDSRSIQEKAVSGYETITVFAFRCLGELSQSDSSSSAQGSRDENK